MATSCGTLNWMSGSIPKSIRRPWRVFEEDLEDKLADAASHGGDVSKETRESFTAIQARGAQAVFMELAEDVQRTYAEVSLMELSAYVCWQRAQAARRQGSSGVDGAQGEAPAEFEDAWDVLDCDNKAGWVPEDPRAVLVSDVAWAALLKDGAPACGGDAGVLVPAAPEPKPKVELDATPLAAKAALVIVKQEPDATPLAGKASQVIVKQRTTTSPNDLATSDDMALQSAKQPLVEASNENAAVSLTAGKSDDIASGAAKGKTLAEAVDSASTVPAAAGNKRPSAVARLKAAIQGSPLPTSADKVLGTAEAPPPKLLSAAAAEISPQSMKDDPQAHQTQNCRHGGRVAGNAAPALTPSTPKPPQPSQVARRNTRQNVAALLASPCKTPVPGVPKRQCDVVPRISIKRHKLPENLCPEALEATCCVCNSGEAEETNDLAMCDRCDRAFHQKCHSPSVRFFGRPEDQWFCASCVDELARARSLRLRTGDFCWASLPANSHGSGGSPPWPARVLKLDFTSLTDPKPYWVQFFDSGPSQGSWVADSQVLPWLAGPSFATLRDSRRRVAFQLAEADGATVLSGGGSTVKRKALGHVSQTVTPVAKRRRVEEDVEEENKEASDNDEQDAEMLNKVDEMKKLINEARERQKRLEQQIEESVAARKV